MNKPAKKLQLDRQRGMLGGVCAGIADYFDINPLFVRIAFVAAVFTWPLTVFVYAILFIVLSNKPTDFKDMGDHLGNSRIGKHFKEINYQKRLYKSVRNKRISGVCGGLAEYFETSPTLVRILFLLSLLFGPFAIFAYIAAAILMDKNPEDGQEPRTYRHTRRRGTRYRSATTAEDSATFTEKRFDKRDLRECSSRFATLEKKLQRLEATITSKRFKLHSEINRI